MPGQQGETFQSAKTDSDKLLLVTDSATQAFSHAHLEKSDPTTTRYLSIPGEQLKTEAGKKRVIAELKTMPKARVLNAVTDKEAQEALQERLKVKRITAQKYNSSNGRDFESRMLSEHGHTLVRKTAESSRFAGTVQTVAEAHAADMGSRAKEEIIERNKRYNQYTTIKDIPPGQQEQTTAYRSNRSRDDKRIVITNSIQNALAHAARSKDDKAQYIVMDKKEQGLHVMRILKDEQKDLIDATDKTVKGLALHQELQKVAKASSKTIDYQPPGEQTWARQLRADKAGQGKDLVLSH